LKGKKPPSPGSSDSGSSHGPPSESSSDEEKSSEPDGSDDESVAPTSARVPSVADTRDSKAVSARLSSLRRVQTDQDDDFNSSVLSFSNSLSGSVQERIEYEYQIQLNARGNVPHPHPWYAIARAAMRKYVYKNIVIGNDFEGQIVELGGNKLWNHRHLPYETSAKVLTVWSDVSPASQLTVEQKAHHVIPSTEQGFASEVSQLYEDASIVFAIDYAPAFHFSKEELYHLLSSGVQVLIARSSTDDAYGTLYHGEGSYVVDFDDGQPAGSINWTHQDLTTHIPLPFWIRGDNVATVKDIFGQEKYVRILATVVQKYGDLVLWRLSLSATAQPWAPPVPVAYSDSLISTSACLPVITSTVFSTETQGKISRYGLVSYKSIWNFRGAFTFSANDQNLIVPKDLITTLQSKCANKVITNDTINALVAYASKYLREHAVPVSLRGCEMVAVWLAIDRSMAMSKVVDADFQVHPLRRALDAVNVFESKVERHNRYRAMEPTESARMPTAGKVVAGAAIAAYFAYRMSKRNVPDKPEGNAYHPPLASIFFDAVGQFLPPFFTSSSDFLSTAFYRAKELIFNKTSMLDKLGFSLGLRQLYLMVEGVLSNLRDSTLRNATIGVLRPQMSNIFVHALFEELLRRAHPVFMVGVPVYEALRSFAPPRDGEGWLLHIVLHTLFQVLPMPVAVVVHTVYNVIALSGVNFDAFRPLARVGPFIWLCVFALGLWYIYRRSVAKKTPQHIPFNATPSGPAPWSEYQMRLFRMQHPRFDGDNILVQNVVNVEPIPVKYLPNLHSNVVLKEIDPWAQIHPPDEPDVKERRGADVVGMVFAGAIPTNWNPDTNSEIQAIINRAIVRKIPVAPDMVGVCKDAVSMFTDLPKVFKPFSYHVWNSRFQASRRRLHDLAVSDLFEEPLNFKDFQIKAFTKEELLTLSYGECEVEDKAKRLIQGLKDRLNVTVGPACLGISKIMAVHHHAWHPKWMYCAGKSSEMIARYAMSGPYRSRDPRYLEDFLGEYDCFGFEQLDYVHNIGKETPCLSSWRHSRVLENDFSGYDGSIGLELLNVERTVYEHLGVPTKILDVLSKMWRTHGCTPSGVRYRVRGTRRSGEPTTSVGNSIITAFVHMVGMAIIGVNDYHMVVLGDDVALFYSDPRVDRFDWKGFMLKFGLRAKPNHRPSNMAVFCSARFWPTDSGTVLAPMPFRVLSKSGLTLNLKMLPAQHLKGVALGLYRDSRVVPVLCEYIDKVLEKYRTVEARALVDHHKAHVLTKLDYDATTVAFFHDIYNCFPSDVLDSLKPAFDSKWPVLVSSALFVQCAQLDA